MLGSTLRAGLFADARKAAGAPRPRLAISPWKALFSQEDTNYIAAL